MATFRTIFRQKEQVSGSATYDDTLTMSSAETYLAKNLETDLNYIRTQLRTITGQTNWFDVPSKNLLELEQGMSGSFQNIYTYTGMSDRNDTSPTYSSNNYVTNGDNLEVAIGKLDTAVAATSPAIKVVERLSVAISSGSTHSLPDGGTYTPATGANMDVYLNGQLLVANTGSEERDYFESSTTELIFSFEIPENSFLAYIIRQ